MAGKGPMSQGADGEQIVRRRQDARGVGGGDGSATGQRDLAHRAQDSIAFARPISRKGTPFVSADYKVGSRA